MREGYGVLVSCAPLVACAKEEGGWRGVAESLLGVPTPSPRGVEVPSSRGDETVLAALDVTSAGGLRVRLVVYQYKERKKKRT